MEIYLIRHTTPLIEKGICYGQSDVAVNEEIFDNEYSSIFKKLPKHADIVYSSPLQRCSKLALKLSSTPYYDARLKELNFKAWENKAWDNINPIHLSAWMQDFVNVKAGGGESYSDLHQRIVSFIEELQTTAHQNVIIVTHAGCIRSFISYVLDLTLENSFRIALAYGEVIRITLAKEADNHKLYLNS